MTGIPYEVVDTPDPRKGPKAKASESTPRALFRRSMMRVLLPSR
jgi:hypothetical protein